MKQKINLITQEGKERLRLLRVKQKIKNFSIFFTACFVVVAVFALAASVLVTNQKNKNAKTISLLSTQIAGQEKLESYALITADRIKIIGKLFKVRTSYREKLSVIDELLVPGFFLQDVDFTSRQGLKITGGCADVQSLTNFNQKVEEIRARKEFSEVLVSSVSRNSDGQYSIVLEVKE